MDGACRFYPPAVRAAVTQLLIARERHGLVCDAAWTAFQVGPFCELCLLVHIVLDQIHMSDGWIVSRIPACELSNGFVARVSLASP